MLIDNGDREQRQRSLWEVFKLIFELRDNPLSVQSTLHRICTVAEKQRRDTVET